MQSHEVTHLNSKGTKESYLNSQQSDLNCSKGISFSSKKTSSPCTLNHAKNACKGYEERKHGQNNPQGKNENYCYVPAPEMFLPDPSIENMFLSPASLSVQFSTDLSVDPITSTNGCWRQMNQVNKEPVLASPYIQGTNQLWVNHMKGHSSSAKKAREQWQTLQAYLAGSTQNSFTCVAQQPTVCNPACTSSQVCIQGICHNVAPYKPIRHIPCNPACQKGSKCVKGVCKKQGGGGGDDDVIIGAVVLLGVVGTFFILRYI